MFEKELLNFSDGFDPIGILTKDAFTNYLDVVHVQTPDTRPFVPTVWSILY